MYIIYLKSVVVACVMMLIKSVNRISGYLTFLETLLTCSNIKNCVYMYMPYLYSTETLKAVK